MLTKEHMRIINEAAAQVFPPRRADFSKYIEDRIRPLREVRDSDVRHIACAGLVKFRRCDFKTNNLGKAS